MMDSDGDSSGSSVDDRMRAPPRAYDSYDSDSSVWTENEMSNAGGLTFREKLKKLFNELRLDQIKGTAILRLLREHPCFSSLPADARTLVQTPQEQTPLRRVEPGEYLHLGVEKGIIDFLEKMEVSAVSNHLILDFSTDGANLDKSGYIIMWPIQIRIVNIHNSTPIIVRIYKGEHKPVSADEFFEEFIDETNGILDNGGVIFHNARISVIIRCFIADAPARALVLNHKYHTGRNSCSKCDVNGVPRTDADYRNQVDEEHHHGPSPLARLRTFNMVKQVPFDWMHLTLIGLGKRQTQATIKGCFSKSVKLSAQEIETGNARVKIVRNYCPREFSRRPVPITNYPRMKATEFRQLLLYTGPVIYHGIYKQTMFEHYLLLHTALRCLASPTPSDTDREYAGDALDEWVNSSAAIYGPDFHSYNIHGHKHLAEDVKNFGPLDSFSAFPYENHMQILRKLCRSPHLPLQQIHRRLEEMRTQSHQFSRNIPLNNQLKPSQVHVSGPLPQNWEYPNFTQYKLLRIPQFTLGINIRDNCCILQDLSICIIRNIIVTSNNNIRRYHLAVQKFDSVDSWFDTGIESSRVGSFKCSNLNPEVICIELNNVSAKCYRMPYWPPPSASSPPPVLPLPDTYIVTVMLH